MTSSSHPSHPASSCTPPAGLGKANWIFPLVPRVWGLLLSREIGYPRMIAFFFFSLAQDLLQPTPPPARAVRRDACRCCCTLPSPEASTYITSAGMQCNLHAASDRRPRASTTPGFSRCAYIHMYFRNVSTPHCTSLEKGVQKCTYLSISCCCM